MVRSWKIWPVPHLVSLIEKEGQKHSVIIITVISHDKKMRMLWICLVTLPSTFFFNTLGAMSELDKAIVMKSKKPELECDNLRAKCS